VPVRLEDRVLTLDGGIDSAQLERVLKAIDSPNRLRMMRSLASRVASVNDIALDLPASTTALHVDSLEAAGLICTGLEPASCGLRKICSRNFDRIILDLPYEAPPPDFTTACHPAYSRRR